jgi:hypothetical protein
MLGTLLAVALGVAATAPVAMRVEVEPLGPSGDKTEVALTVLVSPEDRGRVGADAIIRIELDGGKVSSGSPMRAVKLENGSTRVVLEWPPGEHDLRVQIEDPSKEDTGIWVGRVRIPDLSPGSAQVEPEPTPVPPPVPTPVPTPEPVPVPAPETTSPQPAEPTADAQVSAEDEPAESAAVDEPVVAGAAALGAAAAAEDSSPTDRKEEKTVVEAPPDPVEEVPDSAAAETVATDTGAEIDQPAAAEVDAEAEAETSTDVSTSESPPTEEPPVVEEEQAIVEPLRADPPPEAAEPGTVAPGEPAPTAPAPEPLAVPLSAETAARYDEWQQAEPDTREFSIVVTRGREPELGLDPGVLRLRVGGSDMVIEKLGSPENSPLLLGLAIDVSSEEVDGWTGARGSLASLSDRAGGGRGRVFVATPAGVGAWSTEPKPPPPGGDDTGGGNVASLVKESLKPFIDQRGREFLIVLTDGRNEPSKAEWSDATAVAAASGVPILVVALWDGDFSQRTRKNLKQLTEVSGGSLFLVQGTSQLDSAADRFGRLLDGSYALRFKSASEPTGKPIQISVTSSDKKLDVRAPKSIR